MEKSRAWVEIGKKTQFPGARGPQIEEKKVTTLSGMVVRNFVTFNIFTGPPQARNRKIRVFLGSFGLRQPLPFGEIPGGAGNTKTQFPGARGTFFWSRAGRLCFCLVVGVGWRPADVVYSSTTNAKGDFRDCDEGCDWDAGEDTRNYFLSLSKTII